MYFETLNYEPQYNPSRLRWDLDKRQGDLFDAYWKQRYGLLPAELFDRKENIWLEIGAGTGSFFSKMATLYPDRFLIAIERCRMRAKRLVSKIAKTQYPNLVGYRGNAIPALVNGVPAQRLERLYILYPCPWPKNAQRKNRWYLHPVMPHLVRALQSGGLMIWASDQKFFIDEARWVCESVYGLHVLEHGPIRPNHYNDLAHFEGGRTKFERTFLEEGQPCYELIVQSPLSPS